MHHLLLANGPLGEHGTKPFNIGRGLASHLWVVEPQDHDKLTPIEKTRQSFFEDPRWALINDKRTGRRFYKTGDLVRYTSAGSLDYLGRKDHQIKIHGQRAEIGEIEHQLLRGGEFEHGMVLLPESGAARQRLVAVVSPAAASPGYDRMQLVTGADVAHAKSQLRRLRSRLVWNLPSYINPSVWFIVSSIALNISRKVDRKLVSRWVGAMSEDSLQEANTLAADDEGTIVACSSNEAQLQQLVAQVLNRSPEQIHLNRSFVSLGGDSITAMQLVARARAVQVQLTVCDILKSPDITQLATLVQTTEGAVSLAEETPDVEFALTPVQHMYFEMSGQQPTHFNQSFFLRITHPVRPNQVADAIYQLVARHSMLRARIHKIEDHSTFTQLICGEIEGSYRCRRHEQLDRPAMAAVMAASERTLDITSGPVFSADYFDSLGEQLIFLAAHHLVVNLVSWRILIQEPEEYLQSGRLADSQPSVSFQSWSSLQAQYAHENLSIESVLPYKVPAANYQYWGLPSGENNYATEARQSFTLSAEHTSALLGAANQAYNTDAVDLFLAALVYSFGQTFRNRETPSVFLEGHGREPMDASSNLSSHADSSDIAETVRRLKDRRRQLVSNGWQYFTARYLASGAGTGNAFLDHLPMEVLFNYMGQYQQLERTDPLLREEPRTDLPGVEDIAGHVTRLAFFEVSAVIIHGIARFDFTFSDHMRHQTEISHWIESFQESLTEAATVLPVMSPEKTLSDFPLMSLTYSSLDWLRKGTLADAGLLDLGAVEELYPCSPMQQGRRGLPAALHLRGQQQADNRNCAETLRRVAAGCGPAAHPADLLHRCRLPQRPVRPDGPRDDDNKLQPPHRLVKFETGTRLVCSWEMSHAVVDVFSLGMILGQVTEAYQGPLQAPPARFSDYIRHIQAKDLGSDLEYWKTYLNSVEPCHLPLDGAAGHRAHLRSQTVDLNVQPSALHAFCQAHGVTIANLFQTAWALVLNAVTGSEDVCFGYLATGREALDPAPSEVLGPLINMLVCRVVAAPAKQLRQLVQEVQSNYVTSLGHQDCSLAQIQHALKLSGTPLFNTMMSIQPAGAPSGDVDSLLRFRSIDSQDPTGYDDDVAVNVGFSASEIDITLNYWAPALSDWQATNVCHTLDAVLRAIVADPSQLAGSVDLFTDCHSAHLAAMIASQTSAQPVKSTIPAMFADQVALHPSAPAIYAWDGNLTFRHLDTVSDQIAELLVSRGVAPEVMIPTCFDKSVWYAVVALGVIKAGGAWVALDPSHPPARHEAILQDTSATVVLTSSSYRDRFAAHAAHVICLDQALVDSLPPSGSLLSSLPRAQPSHLAYVVFTSSSTGTPKGIMVEHGSVCSSIVAHGAVLKISPGDRVFQFSAHVFDLSIQEIFTSLIHGACVCVPSDS
ncbi:unnamed protein product [Penicillium nalgiovense]|nr:unnamed protein product [Penicillium nalgiovense]CAG8138491.1 unnamed protein product [Penicillium nalgiovense]CAG8879378.1 unnamed protein product [Penicillium nalgiovense]